MKSGVYFCIICVLLAACNPTETTQSISLQSAQQSINLAWDANAELSSYRIYYGVITGNYDQQMDVGNVTTAAVPGLDQGSSYFFAVTGFTGNGVESGLSNEVSVTGSGPTATPFNVTPTPQPIQTPSPIPGPTQPPGSIILNPTRVNVLAGNGVDPATQIISVTVQGNWNATANRPWMTVHCAAGNCGGSFFILQITTLGLGTGSYSGNVTVTSGAVSTSLPVTLTIISASNPSPTPEPTQKPKSTPEKK